MTEVYGTPNFPVPEADSTTTVRKFLFSTKRLKLIGTTVGSQFSLVWMIAQWTDLLGV